MTDCPWAPQHLLVIVYQRCWWAPWRKRYVLRCWTCELRLPEP